MHRSERYHGMINVVRRPSHSRDVFPPEMLTRAPTDRVDRLRDEMVVERQGHVARVEEGVISDVKRTRGINGYSPFERLRWNVDAQYFFGGVPFAVDVGRFASLAVWFRFVAFDAPFAAREAAGLCSFLRHGNIRSERGRTGLRECRLGS